MKKLLAEAKQANRGDLSGAIKDLEGALAK
jgi:hypothetical protein